MASNATNTTGGSCICRRCRDAFTQTPRQKARGERTCYPCQTDARIQARGWPARKIPPLRMAALDSSALTSVIAGLSIPVPEAGCWIWIGNVQTNGYGRFGRGKRNRHISAHRLSFIAHKGPIPDGLHVCHKCDTPSCVNPDHLYAGTAKDNMRDMFARGRARPFGRTA